MDREQVKRAIAGLPLGALRYYQSTGSTNNIAADWVMAGAPDLALVVADEQTSGRGRLNRTWFTPPGSALAFSLVLRPTWTINSGEGRFNWNAIRYTALGALAVCDALESCYGLVAEIKWPNDVLLDNRKTAGVLAEAQWDGNDLKAVILGIGINITPSSVPSAGQIKFPATCVEEIIGRSISRLELLRQVILQVLTWRECMWETTFIQSWDQRLALRGQWVVLRSANGYDRPETQAGVVLGLDDSGGLKLQNPAGEVFIVSLGEISPTSSIE